ncbi:MAG: response regulator, partial [Gammaproteobacteria bacterium]
MICDDSGFARKQLARALPEGLATDVQFAANGREALAILEAEDIDLMFLDLTMPEMDGYQTLKAMSANDIEVPTIVVSG